MTPGYVLVDACSYCFGAAASTSAVLDRLDPAARLVFVGSGSSLEFLGEDPRFDRVVEANTESWADLERHADLVGDAAVVFANTNPVMGAFAAAVGVPAVCLDIVPWLHPTLAGQVREVRGLPGNAAAMPSVEDAVELLGRLTNLLQAYLVPFDPDPAMRRARLVGPLLHRAATRTDRPRDPALLVSFGGLFNPDVAPAVLERYAVAVAEAAVAAARERGLAEVVFAGPGRLAGLIEARAQDPAVAVGRLPHQRLLERLRTAAHAAIVPGLTTIYEAFHCGPPTLLLPPTNLTQIRQLEAVRARDLGGGLDVGVALRGRFAEVGTPGEVEATRSLAAELAKSLDDGSLRDALAAGFRGLLDAPDPALTERRRALLDELGGSGAAAVALEIESARAAREAVAR